MDFSHAQKVIVYASSARVASDEVSVNDLSRVAGLRMCERGLREW